jgi:hypothetical protein
MDLHHFNYDIARWYLTNYDTIKSFGLNEEDFLSEELKNYINENQENIKNDINRVHAVILPIIRYHEIFQSSYLIPIRSEITKRVDITKILEKPLEVCSRDSLWYLPVLVKRDDFEENIENFAKIISSDLYALYYYLIYIKKDTTKEIYEKFVFECKKYNPSISDEIICNIIKDFTN